MIFQPSHRFVDPLHKHGQEEDRGDGRGQVAGHRLDVVEELATLSRLDHRDPADAHGHDAQDPDPGQGRGGDNGTDQRGLHGTGTLSPHLPTTMSSLSAAWGLRRVQMFMVNRVLLLLKMEAREDMRAASITASISPRKPAGRGVGKEV